MKLEIYRDDFFLVPHFFKAKRNTGWEVDHYGFTWAFTINWFWWELQIMGSPNKENSADETNDGFCSCAPPRYPDDDFNCCDCHKPFRR